MEYYNKNIQLDKNVIIDIISEYKSDYKMLIFGLGYDSKLWYNLTNNNTYFIEDNQKWIDFNKDIDNKNKIKYKYLNLNFKEIAHNKKIENYINNILKNLEVNDDLINLGKFDIILIDGPAGYSKEYPGRIIPCYLSKKYFSKVFKNKTGVSPKHYQLSSRLSHAKELLFEGYSVKETAFYLGYTDPFIFSKQFKAIYGISPNECKHDKRN